MEVHLFPQTVDRVRAALGEDVTLSPADVPAVLARLAVEAPDVYSQVLSEISGSQVRLDSERALRRRRRRGLVRRLFFWWGEYESEVGDRLIAKRHVAAAVPLGLAGLILVLFGVSTMLGHRPAPAPARVSARPVASLPTPRVASRPAVSGTSPLPRRVPAPETSGLVVADPEWPVPAWAPPAPIPPVHRGPSAGTEPPEPVLPHEGGQADRGNPVVFTRQPGSGGTGAPFSIRPDAPGPLSPIVYERTAPTADAADPPWRPAPLPPTGGDGGGQAARGGSGPGATEAAPTTDVALATGVARAQTATSANRHWSRGQRVPARLATGAVVVAGGPPMPVVAESADPAGVWLGHATLGPEGLIQVTFALGTIHGVALDPARLAPGLAGRATMRHPQAAGMVITAALQATADYVQALARQGQVTLVDGWAQLTAGSPPPAWTYLAGRLAQGLDVRAAGGGPVATMELDPNTPLVILLTEVP